MKRINRGLPWGSLVVMVLLAGLPFFCLSSGAYARGGGGFIAGGSVGGGFIGGGGFNGGSFRAGGGWAGGPQGGAVVIPIPRQEITRPEAPQGGEFSRGPRSAGAVREPVGGEAVRGPKFVTGPQGRGVLAGESRNIYGERVYPRGPHMVTAPGNWGPYYGPSYVPPAFAGGGVTVLPGMIVSALPAGAVPRTVAGKRYYYGAGIYYQPCYQGSELSYCVVPDPNK
jgi:hypothetical protein